MFNHRIKSRTLAVTSLAAIMLIAAAATSMATTYNAFAYTRNQATAATNDCGNGEAPTNIGCQNIDCQIQGDENACALTSQQTFPSVVREPPITETATLTVIKVVEGCPAGITCPDPEDFGLTVTGNNPDPDTEFPGEPSPGTLVSLGPGSYSVDETLAPKLPIGLENTPEFSDDCEGMIEAGDTLTCTVTNIISTDLVG